jgi:hypothetical protein
MSKKNDKKDKTPQKFYSSFERIFYHNFSRWFFADVAYTLLPIAVIIFIQIGTKGTTDFLYLSPEWSFATIVSFGVAITSLIELKTEIQHDASHRLYTGTRLYIILLIVSVIILSLVALRDNGLSINERFLWTGQIALLFLSLVSLYMSHIARDKIFSDRNNLPKTIGRRIYYAYLSDSLGQIQSELRYLRFAIGKDKEIDFRSNEPMNKEEVQAIEMDRKNRINLLIEDIEHLYKEVTPLLQDFSATQKTKSTKRQQT